MTVSVYLVTWNLNHERSNYAQARQAFIAHLERYPNVKDSGLESVRWVQSSASAATVESDLRTKLDDNDRLFVTKLNNSEHAGWLQQTAWDWINARV